MRIRKFAVGYLAGVVSTGTIAAVAGYVYTRKLAAQHRIEIDSVKATYAQVQDDRIAMRANEYVKGLMAKGWLYRGTDSLESPDIVSEEDIKAAAAEGETGDEFSGEESDDSDSRQGGKRGSGPGEIGGADTGEGDGTRPPIPADRSSIIRPSPGVRTNVFDYSHTGRGHDKTVGKDIGSDGAVGGAPAKRPKGDRSPAPGSPEGIKALQAEDAAWSEAVQRYNERAKRIPKPVSKDDGRRPWNTKEDADCDADASVDVYETENAWGERAHRDEVLASGARVELITEDSFENHYATYDKRTLSLYCRDDTVVDEEGNVLDESECDVLLGSDHPRLTYGVKAPGRIYIRNFHLMCDFEIIGVDESYREAFYGSGLHDD